MTDQPWTSQSWATPQDAPPGGWAPAALREHPRATLAFVLGLLSVLGMPFFGPFGWYVGRRTVRDIDTQPDAYTNRGIAMAGMVLGIVGTAFLALLILLSLVAFVLIGVALS